MLKTGPRASDFGFVVPAGRTRRLDLGGTFFRVVSANAAFDITIDDLAPFGARTGDVYHAPLGEFFNSLTVTNRSTTAALAVTLTIGQGDIQSPNAAQLPWPTRFVASTTVSIPAGTGILFDGIPSGVLVSRKELIVSNLDAGLNLQLRDAANNPGATVFFSSIVGVEVSDAITVFNPNPGALAVTMAEVWFYNP